MVRVAFKDQTIEVREGESVLGACMRHGIDVPFSCRSGVCQVCLQRAEEGTVPEAAQRGVAPRLAGLGYFLPCMCFPAQALKMAPPRADDLTARAEVRAKERLSADVCRLVLEPYTVFDYRAGQFLNLHRPDGVARSYSLASVPDADPYLEVHVKRVPGGAVSGWVFDTLACGDTVEIQGPQGACTYGATPPGQNLLLIATGTGLAPLLGVLREALQRGHTGAIHLYHGARTAPGIYLADALRDLARRHANFTFHPCVSSLGAPHGFAAGRADDVAFAAHDDLAGWRVFAAGVPAMVDAALARARAQGASAVIGETFLAHAARPAAQAEAMPRDAADVEELNGLLWQALAGGELLRTVLADFYAQVYADPRLASFFHAITAQRAAEKQYLFMRQLLTGERVYFGDRPRNAHHWMVIPDELFDYREDLLMATLRRHGIAEPLVAHWRALDETFRADIVKATAWFRVVDGVEVRQDGYGEMEIDVGSLCDGCGREIARGETVRYHLRLGSTYCSHCHTQDRAVAATTVKDGT